MKIIYLILLIAVAIIMISDVMAEEASSKEASSKEVSSKEATHKPRHSLRGIIIRLQNLWQHILQTILVFWLNLVFNVGWEETYDYLFGVYGMQEIPYFPIPDIM